MELTKQELRFKTGKVENTLLSTYWNRELDFNGNRVFQRNDLINPTLRGADGRTNLQRMLEGDCPYWAR